MPYRNIVYVKLEKRLLNDHRWYMMNEKSQLIWIKILLLGAQYKNRIPKDDITLMSLIRTDMELGTFKSCMEEIKRSFRKLKANRHFYYIKGYEEYTNYIPKRVFPGKSLGTPKAVAEVDVEGEEEGEENKEKKKGEKDPKPSLQEVINYCKERNKGVDPNRWFNFYEAKGWLIGKNKMKDWRAAVRTWEQADNIAPQFKPGGRTPARIRVMTLRTAKLADTDIKKQLIDDGYPETEIDEALGKDY